MYDKISSSISSLKKFKSLVLTDNVFNGSVHNLKRLDSLEQINFSCTKLSPESSSKENYLVSIILRNNSLRTKIPHQLTHFENIPSFLFSLSFLQLLNLASKQFQAVTKTYIRTQFRYICINN